VAFYPGRRPRRPCPGLLSCRPSGAPERRTRVSRRRESVSFAVGRQWPGAAALAVDVAIMTTPFHLISLGALCVAFPIVVCLGRGLGFPSWAKFPSILAAITGLGWTWISWVLFEAIRSGDRSLNYHAAYSLRGTLGGLCCGIVLCIVVARSHGKPPA
jgi:hypothetical protein